MYMAKLYEWIYTAIFAGQLVIAMDIFVSHGGLDHTECGSSEDPCQSIDHAITMSGPDDTILLLPGTLSKQPLLLTP